eukprot:5724300-Amphidinium_carterae.5
MLPGGRAWFAKASPRDFGESDDLMGQQGVEIHDEYYDSENAEIAELDKQFVQLEDRSRKQTLAAKRRRLQTSKGL